MNRYPEVDGPDAAGEPALATLIHTLRERHRDAVEAVVLYGSCLRSGDIFDGLLDCYLICSDYRSAYRSSLAAAANWLLPPNVFYAQAEHNGQVLRSKVTLISLADFQRGCSRRWFESYVWGRFAQPVHFAWVRDTTTREQIEQSLLSAVTTLLGRALPALPAEGTVLALWEQALGLSYGTELRTERPGRAGELVHAFGDYYTAVTAAAAHRLPLALQLDPAGEARYRTQLSAPARIAARAAWAARRVQGKLLSILRLLKALFTFSGGLDYIAWKLTRHSGETIVIPERVRRYPLLFSWGFFWRLYRRGIFK